MTICNMAVELGGRAALIAADDKAYGMAAGKPHSDGLAFDSEQWASDEGAEFDRIVTIDAAEIPPLVSWGTSPDQSVSIEGFVPDGAADMTPKAKAALDRAIAYMGLTAGQSVQDIRIDSAFIGSCTNSRIEDLRAAAKVLKGRKVAAGVQAIIVPGSTLTRMQAEAEGLDKIFADAGFDWRPESGCSMCLAMNDDIAMDGERVASSTNRNFEGRQGRGARTHLMSPAMVAAAAISGHLADVRSFTPEPE
jgi:3-isopropylmalate/(R)-2-methylmalate dehydratase large subunit